MGDIPRRRWWEAFGPGRFAVGAVAVAAVLAGALWHRHPVGIVVLVCALLVGFFAVLRPAMRQAEFGLAVGTRRTVDAFVTDLAQELEAGREEAENCAHLLADDPRLAVEWIGEAWRHALQEWRGPAGPALRSFVLGQLVSSALAQGPATPPDPGRETGVLTYLPPPRRAVFVLCRIANLSFEEAAALLGQPADLVARELRAAEDTVVAMEGT